MAANPKAVARALPPVSSGGGQPGPGGFGGIASTSGNPTTAMSPLVASYEQWTAGRPYGTGLPRIPDSFSSGSFGPLTPITPIGIDKPEDSGRPEPRRFPYPVAWNMPVGEPGTESIRMAPFDALRTISDTYSVARACIELRKNEIIGLEWDIVPTAEAQKAMRGSAAKHRDFAERRAEVLKFFKRPDPEKYHTFSAWMSALLEDVFVVDALSIYMQPSRTKGKGLLGSNLAALCLIDGSSVRPLLDIRGGIPQPPAPAFQVYGYGVPRVDLMTALTGDDVAEMGEQLAAEYRGDQMLYLPYSARNWTPYGFTPLEQALVPVLSGIQRQQFQLSYFADGSVPGMFVSAGNPDMTPQQIRDLQDALNAMAGDPAWKHKIIVLPGGSKIDPIRPVPLADQFDEIIMTQVCMAYSVMPMELGISPKVSSTTSPGAANQMARSSQTVNQRKALRPLLKWLKASIFDFVIHQVCKNHDMEWMWEGLEEGIEEESEVGLLVKEISFGLRSIDEARMMRGEQPWGLPLTSDPIYMTPSGIIPIGSIDPRTGEALGRGNAVGMLPSLPGAPTPISPGPAVHPTPEISSADGKPLPPPRAPTPPAMTGGSNSREQGGGSGNDSKAPGHVAAVAHNTAQEKPRVKSAALRELDLLRRRLIKGRSIDGWQNDHLPDLVWQMLLQYVEGGDAPNEAIDKARQLLHEVIKHDGHADDTHQVYAYLARHYPHGAIEWVKEAHWHGPSTVQLSDIQSGRRPGGSYDADKVKAIVRSIEDGTPPEHPVVLVRTPTGSEYKIADGWHRIDAFRIAGETSVSAWIGTVDESKGSWGAEMNQVSVDYKQDPQAHQ